MDAGIFEVDDGDGQCMDVEADHVYVDNGFVYFYKDSKLEAMFKVNDVSSVIRRVST